MRLEPFVQGFVEKLAELSADRRQALSHAEAGERVLALRGGQAVGAALGVHAARPMYRRALRGLKATGKGAARKRLKGAFLALKALGVVAGSTSGAGLTSRKVVSMSQNYRRDRLEGVPQVPIKTRMHQFGQQVGLESRQVKQLPHQYVSVHKRGA